MSRLPRILLNAATVVSLILCVGTTGAWIQNLSQYDVVIDSPVPMWAIAAALAILPIIAALAWIRPRNSPAMGACPACGYDLRATPGRCPECGTMAAMTNEGTKPAGGWRKAGK